MILHLPVRPSELLYLTTDPNETPLVLPPWARDVSELAELLDAGHARRRKPDTRCPLAPGLRPGDLIGSVVEARP